MKSHFIILFALVELLFSSALFAQSVPALVNYQGRLTDAGGAPLPDGAYRVAFKIWDDPTASSTNIPTHLIWGVEYAVTLIGGTFNVILGGDGGTGIPGAAVSDLRFAFGQSNRFLGLTLTQTPTATITPNQQREIVPRQQLLSSPFAVTANRAASAASADVASALVADVATGLCPPGTVVSYAGANVPAGWILCDGRPVSSGQYPLLYSAISTNWGTGTSGSTNNFNLPDLRGMLLRGVNGSRTDAFADPDRTSRVASATGGSSGNNVGSAQSDVVGSHQHYMSNGSGVLQPGSPYTSPYANNGYNSSFTVSPTGPGIGNETRPKNAYVNYIIKY